MSNYRKQICSICGSELKRMFCVVISPASGMSTNSKTETMSVSYGTAALETPGRNLTIGTAATSIKR